MDKRIGAQLYTVRDLCQDLDGFKKTMKRIADIGYKTVQLSGIKCTEDAEVLKSVFEENGLQVVATHRPFANFADNIEGEIAFHKTLGCKVAGVGGFGLAMRDSIEKTRETVKKCNEIHERLKAEGMSFGWHNHGAEFARLDDGKTSVMDIILEEGNFDLILDAYWIAYVGIDPARFIKKVGERASILHLKDMRVLPDNKVEYAEIGEGNILWNEVLEAAEKSKFAVIEQDICHRDPVDCLETSYKYLTSNFDLN